MILPCFSSVINLYLLFGYISGHKIVSEPDPVCAVKGIAAREWEDLSGREN